MASQVTCQSTVFYTSAFRCQRHYVVRLSVCPSIHPLVQLTITQMTHHLPILASVHPSIHPSWEVSGIFLRMYERNGLKFSMLMYADHLQNWLDFRFWDIFLRMLWRNGLKFGMLTYPVHLQNWWDFGQGLLIFLPLAPLWLSETGKIWGFWAFSGERVGVNAKEAAEAFMMFCMEFCPTFSSGAYVTKAKRLLTKSF